MSQAKEYLKQRLFYDPNTEQIFSTDISVLASTMQMFAKQKCHEQKELCADTIGDNKNRLAVLSAKYPEF